MRMMVTVTVTATKTDLVTVSWTQDLELRCWLGPLDARVRWLARPLNRQAQGQR